jgi:predicted enzyme related to lactoylglutathione lyase
MKFIQIIFVLVFLNTPLMAQNKFDDYEIEGLTLAVNDMPRMLKFYESVFGISFSERTEFGVKLYSGRWANLNVLFCPTEIAKNKATQNKHQFDILVKDLNSWMKKCTENEGVVFSEVVSSEGILSVSIYDPDKNTIY